MVLSQTVLTLEFASEPLKNERSLGLGLKSVLGLLLGLLENNWG